MDAFKLKDDINSDITDAIFTKTVGNCADYVGTYFANVKDIKRREMAIG